AGLLVGALLIETWWTLVLIGVVYLGLIAWSATRYAKIRRERTAKLKPEQPERKPLSVDEVERSLSEHPER
ncbi:MAG: hypothetical protein WBA68_08505, partial [Alteraurantiacibacter sp.]